MREENRSSWKYIARFLRSNGYTVDAIAGTLENLGKNIPLSTLYRNLEGVVCESEEWDEKYTKPLNVYQVMTWVLDYGNPHEETRKLSTDSHFSPISDNIVETMSSSVAALDLGGPPLAAGNASHGEASPSVFDGHGFIEELGYDSGFEFFYPQGKNGSGLKTYLHRCRNQDREMSKLDV
jgi:hypothetical protein